MYTANTGMTCNHAQCHVTRHLYSLQKAVGSSPFYSERWRMSAEHLSAYKKKTYVPIIEVIRVQGGCCLSVVLCTFLSINSCREQRCTPAPLHQNYFLQLFILKTIYKKVYLPRERCVSYLCHTKTKWERWRGVKTEQYGEQNEQNDHCEGQPHFSCSFPAGHSIMDPV